MNTKAQGRNLIVWSEFRLGGKFFFGTRYTHTRVQYFKRRNRFEDNFANIDQTRISL